MKPAIRFVKTSEEEMPPDGWRDRPVEDDLRKIVDATEIRYVNGNLLMTVKGTIQLCHGVINGRCKGNPETAREMIKALEATS